MTVNIKGYHVEVDTESAGIVQSRKWHPIRVKRGVYFHAHTPGGNHVYLHRLIVGAGKGEYVDHKDMNPLNCMKSNLRICTNSQNVLNSNMHRDNKSGFKGVSRHPDPRRKKPWSSTICIHGKRFYLGWFFSASEANEAYKKAAVEMAGEFARW